MGGADKISPNEKVFGCLDNKKLKPVFVYCLLVSQKAEWLNGIAI